VPLRLSHLRGDVHPRARQQGDWFKRSLPAASTHFLVLHERVKRFLMREYGVAAEKVDLAPPIGKRGIFDAQPDIAKRVQVRQELGLRETDVVGIFPARLSPEKGHADLIAALAAVDDARVRCLVVGEGPLRDMLQQQVHANGLGARVLFLPYRQAIEELYQAADFGLVTSHIEGYCMALVEMMAHSLPVISTDVGAAYAMIDTGANGWLVPPGESAKLAAAMSGLAFLSTEARRAMGEAARKAAIERYDPDAGFEATVAAYAKQN
jgi:glycosyltransferase involved in cell wall biosynthesis